MPNRRFLKYVFLINLFSAFLPIARLSGQTNGGSTTLYFGMSNGGGKFYIAPSSNFAGPFIAASNKEMDALLSRGFESALRQGLSPNTQQIIGSIRNTPGADPSLSSQANWLQKVAAIRNAPDLASQLALAALGPVEKAAQNRNPFEMVEKLDGFGKTLSDLAKHGHGEAARKAEELAKGAYVDGDGLILGLPDAPAPVRLISPWTSSTGLRVRKGLNRLMVSKQIIDGEYRNYCASHGEKECKTLSSEIAKFHTKYVELALMYEIAERLGLESNPSFLTLISALEKTNDFTDGFVKGLVVTGFDFVENSQKLAETFVKGDLGLVLFDTIIHTDTTLAAIGQALDKQWDRFLNGTAEERGQVIGRATGEVLLILIPGIKSVQLTEGLGVTAEVSRLVEGGGSLAQKLGTLSERGSLKILGNATEKALDRVAVFEKVDAMASTGIVSAESAKSFKAMADVFPKGTAEVLREGLGFGDIARTAHYYPQVFSP